jgi:hypothetical protein
MSGHPERFAPGELVPGRDRAAAVVFAFDHDLVTRD